MSLSRQLNTSFGLLVLSLFAAPQNSSASISGVCASLQVPMDELDLGDLGSVCIVKQMKSPNKIHGIREGISCDQSKNNPGQLAQSEACPTAYGTCESGVCTPIKDGWYKDTWGRDWEGIGTFPYATVTYYGGSTGCGSWSLADGSNDVNALVKCMKNAHIDGIMAVPHLMTGDRNTAAQACYKNNDLCYYITGPAGSVVSAIFDHCGGFVQCIGGTPADDSSILNLTPEVQDGVIYTDGNMCTSLGHQVAAGLQPDCTCHGYKPKGEKGTECCPNPCSNFLNTDWCGGNDHPHFDMDVDSAGMVCPDIVAMGSCVLSKVQPMLCPVPQPTMPFCCSSGDCVNCLNMNTDSGCIADKNSCSACGGKWCVVDDNYNLCDLKSPLPTVNPMTPSSVPDTGTTKPGSTTTSARTPSGKTTSSSSETTSTSSETTSSSETTTSAGGGSVATTTSGQAPGPPITGGGFTGQGTTTTTTTQKPFPIGAVIGAVAGVAALAAAGVAYTMLQGPPAPPVFEFEGEEAGARGEAQRETQVAMGEADFA